MTSTVLAVLASLGGVVVFVAGVWTVARSIFGLVNATKDNTEQLGRLNERLARNIEQTQATLSSHGERISSLEGKVTETALSHLAERTTRLEGRER